MKRFLFIISANILFISGLFSQNQKPTGFINSISEFSVNYGFHFPGADLAERFGEGHTVGISFNYKTDQNWKWGVNANYLFGSKIKEPRYMNNILTSSGDVIDQGGVLAAMLTNERGGIFSVSLGKIISTNKVNKNSGILLQVAPGYMYHQILIDLRDNNTPQLMGDYKKGYDRLSGGFVLEEFIGFVHYDDNRLFNFYGGFEFRQGITKSLRPWDFDLNAADTKTRIDLMFGIKVGWIVPIGKKENPEQEHTFYY